MTLLPCIEIDAPSPKSSVIWLHGLGADGSDFVPIVPELHLPESLGMRFVFPHAPVMPITMNQGYQMPAWFDIFELSVQSRIDEEGIGRSVGMVTQIIQQEVERGIPANRIILAGFSQGSVIALASALNYPLRLGGVIALSGYLPIADQLLQKANPINKDVPIFIAHGTEDNVLPYALGKATYVALQQAGYPVSWYSYPMAHSVCAKEVADISDWLQKTVAD
jgi:phospholipase/carboxylesterase